MLTSSNHAQIIRDEKKERSMYYQEEVYYIKIAAVPGSQYGKFLSCLNLGLKISN